jgi:hypothetical protein
MMKYAIYIVSIFFIVMVYFIIKPKYKAEFIYSPDHKTCITRMDRWTLKTLRTVFIYGHYDNMKIPDQKLEPIYNTGFLKGFFMVLEWRGDTAIFHSVDIDGFENNLPPKMILKEYDGQNEEDMSEWFKIKNDSSVRFISLKDKWF